MSTELPKVPCTRTTGRGCAADGLQDQLFQPLLGADAACAAPVGATSAIDALTEARLQQALLTLLAGRTSFVVAHRLSTIRHADLVLVLDRGRVVERGTHAELLAVNGRYRYLHDKQYKFETDRFINPGEDFTPEPEQAKTAAPLARSL